MTFLAKRCLQTLLVLLPLLGILWVLQVPYSLGLSVVTASYLSLMAGLGVGAALLFDAAEGRRVVLNLILAALAIACWSWGALNHEAWLISFTRGPEKWLPGAFAVLLLFEALRRLCGLGISLSVLVSLSYGFLGHLLPGLLEGAYTAPPRLVL